MNKHEEAVALDPQSATPLVVRQAGPKAEERFYEFFAASTLGRAEFNPSAGITLAFSDLVVTLKGRCLDSLFVAIRQQQAVWVCESDRATRDLVPAAVPLVESVTVEPFRGGSLKP